MFGIEWEVRRMLCVCRLFHAHICTRHDLAHFSLHIHYITLRYITLHAYIHTYRHACMHACIHACSASIHAYIRTCVHASLHPCIHACKVQGISRNYVQKLCGEIQAHAPENSGINVGFSRGWPEIEKLRRHVREHLPSSPHSMAMHSRCHLNAYGHLYLSASTPHPGRSQAKPNHAANSPRKVTMHFYAPANCIWQHVLK